MSQNPNRLKAKYPTFYRQDLLEWQRSNLGWSQRKTALRAKINQETIKKVFKGIATQSRVYPVAVALGLDWAMLHNLKLKPSEFHLALTNGGKSAG